MAFFVEFMVEAKVPTPVIAATARTVILVQVGGGSAQVVTGALVTNICVSVFHVTHRSDNTYGS